MPASHAQGASIDAQPTSRSSLTVELISDTTARVAPRHGARPLMRVQAIAPLGGGITGLLVYGNGETETMTAY